MEWDFERSVTSARLLAELGMDHGLPLSACLAGTGLSERDLQDAAMIVTARQELRLIRNLLGRLGDVPGLGLEAGQRYHFTAFGLLGFAMASSPNALGALNLALRYFHLTFAFTRFHVAAEGVETHITLDDASLPADVRAFVVERDAAAVVTVQRDLFSARPGLLGVCLKSPEPRDVHPHQAFYGLRPVFNAACNKLIMSTSALFQALPQGNELALRAAEEQCRNLLDRYSTRAGLSGRVRGLLVQNAGQLPDMNDVSAQLHMTPRTLRRRLADEGTTFLKLRDEVRFELAEELLAKFSLSVEQIAERLGYSESTCFINAFKRWTGMTPLAFHKRLNRA